MNFFGHVLMGVLFGGGTAFALNTAIPGSVPYDAGVLGLVLLGALLPDADHPKTRLHELLLVLTAAAAFGFFWKATGSLVIALGGGLVTALAFILLKPRHRCITHSLLAALIFGAVVWTFTKSWPQAAVGIAAYVSHLVADRVLKVA